MRNGLIDKAIREFTLNGKEYSYYSIASLEEEGFNIKRLPFSIKVLLESVLRQFDGHSITKEHIYNLADWTKNQGGLTDVPFKPARIILQDFTGVPAVLDLASMRSALEQLPGGMSIIDEINPEVRVDLVIDHSVQVDYYGDKASFDKNVALEFERNQERYQFLKWAQGAFSNLTVVPPAMGIIHQVNLEYLASVVMSKNEAGRTILYPDTLLGTDSHTTMINGLGVLGWGVGGIEAEAGMLGQPSYFTTPEVVGVKLIGKMPLGATATDLALLVTKRLRDRGVVGKFVEFFGRGVSDLSLADRATIANMSPEYGATCCYFPVDEITLEYLKLTGRSIEHIEEARTYLEKNSMFYGDKDFEPVYTEVIELDLGTVEASLAGPKRPQDLLHLQNAKSDFISSVAAPLGNHGHGLLEEELNKKIRVKLKDGRESTMSTGSVVIASITSCTNTSNPSVMLGAGLIAKHAVEKGLKVPAHVKTSLAPGSRVVTGYLKAAGLLPYLEELGFNVVGYGCATCIGNSGPLLPEISEAITDNDLLVTSVLSGNRNFEGRIHQLVKANYLASPPLVVAYALAGRFDIDLINEPLGTDSENNEVYLKDIWPTQWEIEELITGSVKPSLYQKEYGRVYDSNQKWNAIEANDSKLYQFDKSSTYIQNPPFFENIDKGPSYSNSLMGLSCIARFGDSVTTDHISPAGAIGKNTPAGKYLIEHGISPSDFNTYGSRRGNHEVMMRGTFANIRIRNRIAPGTEGGYTTYWPTGETMSIYDACMKYKEAGTGLIVLAGTDYGMGSSRDWAAKGPSLLGVKVVIAESFERIHRSNLVMMGIVPLQYIDGASCESLGLMGDETYEVELTDSIKPQDIVTVRATRMDGSIIEFRTRLRFDSAVDIDYYRQGGILRMVLRQKLSV